MACKPALYYLITLPITLEWLPPGHPEDPFCYVQPGVHSHLHLAVSSFHRVSKVLLSPFNASLSFEAFTACLLAHTVKHISWVFMSLLQGRNNLVHTYWTWMSLYIRTMSYFLCCKWHKVLHSFAGEDFWHLATWIWNPIQDYERSMKKDITLVKCLHYGDEEEMM